MQTTAIGTVAKSLPQNVVILLTLLIPKRYIPYTDLLKIPVGGLTTYGDIAVGINNPRACRAVGTAVGENPVAFLIPCHRVIRASGELGNYHWGEIRKTAMIGWEAAKGEVKRGL